MSSPVILLRRLRASPHRNPRRSADGRILAAWSSRRRTSDRSTLTRDAQEDPDDDVARLPRAPPPRHPGARRAQAPSGLHDRRLRHRPRVRCLRRSRRHRDAGRGDPRLRRRRDPLHVPHRGALPLGRRGGPLGHLPRAGRRSPGHARDRVPLSLRASAAESADRRRAGPGNGVGDDLRPRATAGRAVPHPRREAGSLRRRAARRRARRRSCVSPRGWRSTPRATST